MGNTNRPSASGADQSGARVSVSADNTSTSDSADSSGTISTPALAPFVTKSTLFETNQERCIIYGAAFNPYQSKEYPPLLATASKNMVRIYNCPIDRKEIVFCRAIVDTNVEESFFALTWAYDIVDKRHCVLAAGFAGRIKVIDPNSGELLKELLGHGDCVNELRTDPSNSMIVASASKDASIRIWNIRIERCLVVLGGLHGHMDEVLSMDWSPDSRFLASASMDHSISMWNINDKAQRIIDYSMTPEGEKRISEREAGSPEECQMVSIAFPNSVTSDLHIDYVDCIRFIGWHVISRSMNWAVLSRFGSHSDQFDKIYANVDTVHSRIAPFYLTNSDAWFLKFDIHPQRTWIAFGTLTGDILFFFLRDIDNLGQTPDHTVSIGRSPIRQLAFEGAGHILIAVCDDGSVTRLDARTQVTRKRH